MGAALAATIAAKAAPTFVKKLLHDYLLYKRFGGINFRLIRKPRSNHFPHCRLAIVCAGFYRRLTYRYRKFFL